jgi:hypothetical protein
MSCRNCLLLLLVLVCGAWAQKARQSLWKEYVYPEDRFAIRAPASPRIYPDPQAPDVRIYHWDLAPLVVFTIHSGVRPNCLDVLATFKSSPAKSKYGEKIPGSMKDISLSGYKGLQYEMVLVTGRRAFERLYCAKEKSYSLTLAFPGSQTKSAEADLMFSSFRLVETGSR